MTNKDLFRLLQHVPVGAVNIAFAVVSPMTALLFGVAFLVYEVTQGGNPHIDIRGYCWGLALGGIVWFLINTFF